jgi:hypothetical protein
MTTILLTDRNWPQMFEVACDLADKLIQFHVKLVFLSGYRKSEEIRNLNVVNVNDIPQDRTIEELQEQYDFSIWKAILVERAFFDFTFLAKKNIYSNVGAVKRDLWLKKYLNALDYLIREKVDAVYDNAPDSFIETSACYISNFYKKPFNSMFLNYYDGESLFFFDKRNWTSSSILRNYEKFFNSNEPMSDLVQVEEYFSKKDSLYQIPSNRFSVRKNEFINRWRTYEPISIANWIHRRISNLVDPMRIALKLKIHKRLSPEFDKNFVVYPLHVVPEASLLGASPELADQLSVIKNISMNLPWGTQLFVKEHPHQRFGKTSLSYDFISKLCQLPNVRFVRSSISMSEITKSNKLLCVIGINGTALFESMIERRPAIVLGEPYFLSKEYFFHVKCYEDIFAIVKNLIANPFTPNERARYSMLKAIMSSSIQKEGHSLSKATHSQLEFAKSYNAFICENVVRELL